jgi:hypothetical protein
VGATDTLFMLKKRCGIRKEAANMLRVIIIQVYAYAKMWTSERGGAAKNVIYHKVKEA